MPVRLRALTVVGTAALALVWAAGPSLADAGSAAPDTVQITVDSAGIHAPAALPAGVTTFTETSSLPGTDAMGVVRLDDGTTYDQVYAALGQGELATALTLVTGEGGIAHGGPHNGATWTSLLRAGDYLLVDDEHGFVAPLTATGPRQNTRRPHADGSVLFTDDGISLPAGFGDGTWQFHDADVLQHGLGIVHIAPGHSRSDVEQAIASDSRPDWLEPQGTLQMLGTGQTAWLTLTGMSGMYVIVDYLPVIQGAASGPTVQFFTAA